MISAHDHTRRINDKLQLLLKQFQTLQKDNERLKTELDKQKETESEFKQKAEILEQQLAIVKASSGQIDEASKKELEKRINHYIREIDRCIAELGG